MVIFPQPYILAEKQTRELFWQVEGVIIFTYVRLFSLSWWSYSLYCDGSRNLLRGLEACGGKSLGKPDYQPCLTISFSEVIGFQFLKIGFSMLAFSFPLAVCKGQ